MKVNLKYRYFRWWLVRSFLCVCVRVPGFVSLFSNRRLAHSLTHEDSPRRLAATHRDSHSETHTETHDDSRRFTKLSKRLRKTRHDDTGRLRKTHEDSRKLSSRRPTKTQGRMKTHAEPRRVTAIHK